MNDHNPMQHFHQWFYHVRDQFPKDEVNAIALSTMGLDGFPKTRRVLLKQYDWDGFTFYTQYTSEKGKAINVNPKVGLNFLWEAAGKQISVSGIATKTTTAQSDAYFDTRPRGSRIGAWASHQSKPIDSRQGLDFIYHQYDRKFFDQPISRPTRWGGYLVRPLEMQFRQTQNGMIKCTNYVLENKLDWKRTAFFVPFEISLQS